jgi:hypothetical protein
MEFAVGGPLHGLQLKRRHFAPFVRIC